ncbi:hypothetical protein D3C80_2150890 [compost metagenome]
MEVPPRIIRHGIRVWLMGSSFQVAKAVVIGQTSVSELLTHLVDIQAQFAGSQAHSFLLFESSAFAAGFNDVW